MQIAVLRVEIKASNMFVRAVDSKNIVDYLLLLECGFEFDLEANITFVLANSIAAIN